MKWQAILGSILAHASAIAWMGTASGGQRGAELSTVEFTVLEPVELGVELPPPPPPPEPMAEPPTELETPPPPAPEPAPNPAPKPRPRAKPAPRPAAPAPAAAKGPRKLDLTMSNAGGQSVGQGSGSGGAMGSAGGGKGSGKGGGAEPAAEACKDKLSKPVPKSKVPIRYPEGARVQGVEGRVVLRAHVDIRGHVTRVEVLKSPGPLLDAEVQAALRQWTFEPARRCGKAVATTYKLDRRFELEG